MSVYRRHTSSLYYSSEVDRLVHRRKYGIGELQLYDTVNKHFQGRYKRGLVNLANSVFGDLFVDAQRTDNYTFFDEATEAFPEFAMAFLSELKILRARRGPGEDETVEL